MADDAPLDLREAGGGVTIRIRVQPRAAREGIGGLREGALVVRLTAPPVEGAANRALTKLLAKTLEVAPSAIEIVRGDRGRDKVVRVEGITVQAANARIGR